MAFINFQPKDFFNTILNTGDGTTNKSFTGVGFQPDLVWNKIRSTTYGHWLYDAVRGAGAEKEISSNTNSAEGASDNEIYGYISSFDSDGFSVTGSSNSAYFNQNNETYVNWNWRANGAGVSNTDGSITSTVSASTTSGFSIVKYTGTGANATVGHGLGAVPKFIIVKALNDPRSWITYNSTNGATGGIDLNSTGAFATNSTLWNNTSPTSSVVHLGTSVQSNSTYDYIMYCFAEKKGFSKFGSYVGNASATDNAFIYCGFKPAFVITKCSSIAGDRWTLYDNKRDPYNYVYRRLFPDGNIAESLNTGADIDFLSNGFKIRTDAGTSGASQTYIFMAFAEEPLVSSNGVPNTAR